MPGRRGHQSGDPAPRHMGTLVSILWDWRHPRVATILPRVRDEPGHGDEPRPSCGGVSHMATESKGGCARDGGAPTGGQSSVWGGGRLLDRLQRQAPRPQCCSERCHHAQSHRWGVPKGDTTRGGSWHPALHPRVTTPASLEAARSPHPAAPPSQSRAPPGGRRASSVPAPPLPSWPLWVVCAGSRSPSLPGTVALGTSARQSRFLQHFPPN